jgi:hypothetical protein
MCSGRCTASRCCPHCAARLIRPYLTWLAFADWLNAGIVRNTPSLLGEVSGLLG